MSSLSLRERLSSTEQQLISALSDGEHALEEFERSWTALQNEIEATASYIDSDTLSLSWLVASRIQVIVEGMASMETQMEQLASASQAECEAILARYMSSQSQSSNDSRNKHVEASYRWLAKNIHNPYPSSSVKRSLAEETGAALKNIDEWFQRARRRIGWNEVCKNRYSGSRSGMLLCAHRHFVEPDPEHPLTPDMQMDFADIEMKAKHLYNSRFHVSDECKKLGAMVKTVAKDHRSETVGAASRPPLDMDTTCLRSSSSSSSSTSLGSISKRRRHAVNESTRSRRSRSGSNDSDLFSPSPSSTPSDSSAPWNMVEDRTSPVSTVATLPTPSRKRRLSEADAESAPKRPKGMSMAPHAHAVSAPIPKSASYEDLSKHDGAAFHPAEDFMNMGLPIQPSALEQDATLLSQSLSPAFDADLLNAWLTIPDSAITMPPVSCQAAPAFDLQMDAFGSNPWPILDGIEDPLAPFMKLLKECPEIPAAPVSSIKPSQSIMPPAQAEVFFFQWDPSMFPAPTDPFLSPFSFDLAAISFPDPITQVQEPVVPGVPISFGAAASLADPVALARPIMSREELQAKIASHTQELNQLLAMQAASA
uniref:Homeodomain mating type HD1-2 protein n=1 Tax=Limonomyces culmigenus TaxID=228944 RepID=A0A0N7J0T3_9AGAM|nr:homeodomain mating type HD1-2 protein [Limonomyces culmigenus]